VECADSLFVSDHQQCRTGFPKLSLSLYPFSISIDEHVPLNISAGIFFPGRTIVDFPKVGQKNFCRGGAKSGKIRFP